LWENEKDNSGLRDGLCPLAVFGKLISLSEWVVGKGEYKLCTTQVNKTLMITWWRCKNYNQQSQTPFFEVD
jgi:hypothetical protein